MVQNDNFDNAKNSSMLQKASTTDGFSGNESYKTRRRRFTMPLAYQLYESQQEDLRGTINGPDSPDFRPEVASRSLRKALEAGIETDDGTITSIILHHNGYQRQKIIDAYSDMYNRDLLRDLQEEIGGYFFVLAQALFTSPQTYSAQIIYNCITDINADRSVAVEILCTRTATQLKVLRDAYMARYEKTLEKDIELKVEGIFGKMLRLLLVKPRSEDRQDVDLNLAQKHAALLLNDPEAVNQIGRDINLFEMLFVGHSWGQIAAFMHEYNKRESKKKRLQTIVKLDKELHADVQKMLLIIFKIAQNEQMYFAEKLYNAIFDTNINHKTIIRIAVTRSETDLLDICELYEEKYKRCFEMDVLKTCSGEYAKLLSRLVACPGKQHSFVVSSVEL